MRVTIKNPATGIILCMLLLIISAPTCAQITGQRQVMRDARRLASGSTNAEHFRRTLFYIEKQNWDSVLVFSMKQLYERSTPAIRDYSHFFRGIAFRSKRLLKQSRMEFEHVSPTFVYYYKVTIGLAELALERGRFNTSLNYYRQLEKDWQSGWAIERGAFYHNMGLCYFHLQQYGPAEAYLLKGSELRTVNRDTAGMIASFMDIGNLYYEQYRDAEAIPYFLKAYRLTKTSGDFLLKQTAALNMAVVEENRKHYIPALNYRKEYESWTDSLSDQNKVWAVAEIEKKFALSRKQKQVDKLRSRNALRQAERNTLLYCSILLLLLLTILVYFYRQRIRRSRIIEEQKGELALLNATKDRLFSIVSHDLRSSVSALKTSNSTLMKNLRTQNYDKLDEQLQHNSAIANSTYGLLDNLLHWALLQTGQYRFHPEPIRLSTLVEHVVYNYKPLMDVKNIRFENGVPQHIEVLVDTESCKLLLRNLIDNSIRYTGENGSISVYSLPDSDGAACTLIVEDTGIGMTAALREELLSESPGLSKKQREEDIGTGLGMQLCKSMVRRNSGRLGIESTPGAGTRILITLPQIHYT